MSLSALSRDIWSIIFAHFLEWDMRQIYGLFGASVYFRALVARYFGPRARPHLRDNYMCMAAERFDAAFMLIDDTEVLSLMLFYQTMENAVRTAETTRHAWQILRSKIEHAEAALARRTWQVNNEHWAHGRLQKHRGDDDREWTIARQAKARKTVSALESSTQYVEATKAMAAANEWRRALGAEEQHIFSPPNGIVYKRWQQARAQQVEELEQRLKRARTESE